MTTKATFDEIHSALGGSSKLSVDYFPTSKLPSDIANDLGWSLEEYYKVLEKAADERKKFLDAWKTHSQIMKTFSEYAPPVTPREYFKNDAEKALRTFLRKGSGLLKIRSLVITKAVKDTAKIKNLLFPHPFEAAYCFRGTLDEAGITFPETNPGDWGDCTMDEIIISSSQGVK